MIAVRTLLKSWATPPASWPTACIFWLWANCCSSARCVGDVEGVDDHRFVLAGALLDRVDIDARARRRCRRCVASIGGMSPLPGDRRGEGRLELRPVGLGDQVDQPLPVVALALDRAEDAQERRVGPADPAPPVERGDGHRRVVEEAGEAHFRRPQPPPNLLAGARG